MNTYICGWRVRRFSDSLSICPKGHRPMDVDLAENGIYHFVYRFLLPAKSNFLRSFEVLHRWEANLKIWSARASVDKTYQALIWTQTRRGQAAPIAEAEDIIRSTAFSIRFVCGTKMSALI